MSKYSVIRKPRISTHRGEAGPCGVEVNTRARDNGKLGRPLGLIAITERSGLFDPGSAFLEPFAEELYEYGRGKFVVSTVGTNYPKADLVKMWDGLSDAREARAISMLRAIQHINAKYRPRVALQSGLSEGGINAVDATEDWLELDDRFKLHIPAKTAVLTIDTPMVIEPERNPAVVAKTLAELTANCMPDLMGLDRDQRKLIRAAQRRHKTSAWDFAYGAAEIGFLSSGVDLRPQVERLEEAGIPVWHASYSASVVPNTQIAQEHSREFEGTHVGVMRNPGPVIEYIGEIVHGMLEESGVDPVRFGLAA